MRAALLLSIILSALSSLADEPVTWSGRVNMTSGNTGEIRLTAVPNGGYHFYALPPDGGINPLEITIEPQPGINITGAPIPSKGAKMHFDEAQGAEIAQWDSKVRFTIPFEITDDQSHDITLKIRGQACCEEMCAMMRASLTVKATYDPAKGITPIVSAKSETTEKPATTEKSVKSEISEGPKTPEVDDTTDTTDTAESAETSGVAEDPEDPEASAISQVAPLKAASLPAQLTQGQPQWWEPSKTTAAETTGLWMTLLLGFLGGLAALLTPCVWPMIPMTVSFFLKSSKGSRLNRGALLYGLAIVVIYVALGLLITLLFGAGKLNELSTSAVFNIIFFAILVIFAISFFGAFEIKLPARWSNAIDSKAESTTGLISIFFMAFTLALVSFSCTGPIIGTLLVATAAEGEILGPAIGMGGFALGLALPFTLCALFPGMLKTMPRSGGWLNSVKVVLGFIELILSLKFLSVADMAYGWHLLDREVFLSLWIVLFILLGMYLLGKLRFSHDSPRDHVGVGSFLLALLPLSFAVYLIPGLWGAPLKSASAFVPPLTTQDFNLYAHSREITEFDDYTRGMEYAREHKMPVLIDFSGYGCVNCRQMEEAVINTEQVHTFIAENFVVIKLMVDSKTPLAEPIIVDNGTDRIELETIGDKWMFLQNYKFGASTQPYYVILDNDGAMLNEPASYHKSPERFMTFLQQGLEKYHLFN